MKSYRNEIILGVLIVFLSFNATCQQKISSVKISKLKVEKKRKKKRKKKVKLPKIDLSHWKVTLPFANKEGKPVEINPPEILDFANN